MIGSNRKLTVYAYRTPVDMRKSFNTLSVLVTRDLGRDVMSGDLFVFIGRSRRRAKVLHWDGTGLCVLSKRLSKGHFSAPWAQPGQGPLVLTTSELSLLLDGADVLGRLPLSPPPYSRAERVIHWR